MKKKITELWGAFVGTQGDKISCAKSDLIWNRNRTRTLFFFLFFLMWKNVGGYRWVNNNDILLVWPARTRKWSTSVCLFRNRNMRERARARMMGMTTTDSKLLRVCGWCAFVKILLSLSTVHAHSLTHSLSHAHCRLGVYMLLFFFA